MRPYTKEGLLARQQKQHHETSPGGGGGGGDSNNNGGAVDAKMADREEGSGGGVEGDGRSEFPDSYYEYKLAGVLVHAGTADSGHYYSYIKRRNTKARKIKNQERCLGEGI